MVQINQKDFIFYVISYDRRIIYIDKGKNNMVPKFGDIVKFTEDFIRRHEETFLEERDQVWRSQYNNFSLFINEVNENVPSGDTNIKFYVLMDPDITGKIRIDLRSGRFGYDDEWPIVFKYAEDNLPNNSSIYCNCDGPFVITGFTSAYKVCTKCHKEKK